MKLKKNYLYGIVLLVILIIAGGIFLSGKGESTSTQTENNGEIEGNVQKVVISMKDYNYYPQEVRVKADQPVEISLDNSVGGCFRNFNIPKLDISKQMSTPQDKLTFTPTEKGMYTFTCGMGMGTGTLIVE